MPYVKILTSPVVWSIAMNDFAYSFSYVMFSQFLPSFLRDVMHMDMRTVGGLLLQVSMF